MKRLVEFCGVYLGTRVPLLKIFILRVDILFVVPDFFLPDRVDLLIFLFFWVGYIFSCVSFCFKERTYFIAGFLLSLVRIWAFIDLECPFMGPYVLKWWQWWFISWVMNLKGHKVFQFGRLRGSKSHLVRVASSLGLVFLAYLKVNTSTCWIFCCYASVFSIFIFIFPKVPSGKSGSGSERVAVVQYLLPTSGILLGLFGDPKVIEAWFLWGDRHPTGHCINANIGASAKDNVRSDLGSDACSFHLC